MAFLRPFGYKVAQLYSNTDGRSKTKTNRSDLLRGLAKHWRGRRFSKIDLQIEMDLISIWQLYFCLRRKRSELSLKEQLFVQLTCKKAIKWLEKLISIS